jgi:hypothetical protein
MAALSGVAQRLVAVSCALVVVLASLPLAATVVRHVPLAELIKESDLIVSATVMGHRSFYDERMGQIMTDTTLRVERSWLGGVKRGVCQ